MGELDAQFPTRVLQILHEIGGIATDATLSGNGSTASPLSVLASAWTGPTLGAVTNASGSLSSLTVNNPNPSATSGLLLAFVVSTNAIATGIGWTQRATTHGPVVYATAFTAPVSSSPSYVFSSTGTVVQAYILEIKANGAGTATFDAAFGQESITPSSTSGGISGGFATGVSKAFVCAFVSQTNLTDHPSLASPYAMLPDASLLAATGANIGTLRAATAGRTPALGFGLPGATTTNAGETLVLYASVA